MANLPIRSDKDIQRILQDHENRLIEIETRDINLRNARRVINSPRAKKEDDLITLGQVEDLLKDIKRTLERLKNVT
jgi:hypothetical protein